MVGKINTEGLSPELAALYDRALEDENGCYIWQHSRRGNGYGQTATPRGKSVPAHRRALELHLGRPLLPGTEACHHCDVRPCIRVEHLFEGTHSENMLDASRKGRLGMQRYPERCYFSKPESNATRPRGARHGSAKLTEADVLEIRANMHLGPTALSKRFGVVTSIIARIRRNELWGHVQLPAPATEGEGR